MIHYIQRYTLLHLIYFISFKTDIQNQAHSLCCLTLAIRERIHYDTKRHQRIYRIPRTVWTILCNDSMGGVVLMNLIKFLNRLNKQSLEMRKAHARRMMINYYNTINQGKVSIPSFILADMAVEEKFGA